MFESFTKGLLLVGFSELGDKTFFITAILAMRHPRRWVLVGAIAALTTMTIISVLMGQAVSHFPKVYVRGAEVILFIAFGLKLLYDATQMTHQPNLEEQKEAAEAVEKAEAKLSKKSFHRGAGVRGFWGRGTWVIVGEAFSLIFLAEWGDRTQFATIALAAANNPLGVTLGSILGHAICAAIAVMCGRFVCGRISERTITTLGGALFLIFAVVAGLELGQSGGI
ncbi:MAG: TMEM165/GDT1 family protein [Timaviella obliquedivisa GSE-PSE-MK23-08B]|nr:TMEM165/GDT1 family protein [Timaviella obliquedivisa GSE-PSE-MK23-08B]